MLLFQISTLSKSSFQSFYAKHLLPSPQRKFGTGSLPVYALRTHNTTEVNITFYFGKPLSIFKTL